jgi:hypothetical protein
LGSSRSWSRLGSSRSWSSRSWSRLGSSRSWSSRFESSRFGSARHWSRFGSSRFGSRSRSRFGSSRFGSRSRSRFESSRFGSRFRRDWSWGRFRRGWRWRGRIRGWFWGRCWGVVVIIVIVIVVVIIVVVVVVIIDQKDHQFSVDKTSAAFNLSAPYSAVNGGIKEGSSIILARSYTSIFTSVHTRNGIVNTTTETVICTVARLLAGINVALIKTCGDVIISHDIFQDAGVDGLLEQLVLLGFGLAMTSILDHVAAAPEEGSRHQRGLSQEKRGGNLCIHLSD